MNKKTKIERNTFDQQIELLGLNVESADIRPNSRISAEVVFEPVLKGVRVTARDSSHRVLWGFIGSKGMIDQHPCQMAVYATLRDLLSEELEKHELPAPDRGKPRVEAERSLDLLSQAVNDLRKSISVKSASSVTTRRAAEVARIANDAFEMIRLETEGLKS